MFSKVEEPDYTVLESLENNVEIREYRPQIWAATVKGSENGPLALWQATSLEITAIKSA